LRFSPCVQTAVYAKTCFQKIKKLIQKKHRGQKKKMSTLNIIRNKLVFRVFAVVKRQTPYVDLTTFAA